MPSIRLITVVLVAAALIAWRFPLVHISRLDDPTKVTAETTFDAKQVADEFWTSRLPVALDSAHDVRTTLEAILKDPAAACRELGRTVGVSRSCMYLVQGRGVVQSIDNNAIAVNVQGEPPLTVILNMGLIFGNLVRDVTLAVEKGGPTDSRGLNDVSTAINGLIEKRVITEAKAQAAVGAKVRFVGCASVQGAVPTDQPWNLTPLHVEFEK